MQGLRTYIQFVCVQDTSWQPLRWMNYLVWTPIHRAVSYELHTH